MKSNRSKHVATSVDQLCVVSLYDESVHADELKDGVGRQLGKLEKVVGIEIKCMTNKNTTDEAF